MKGVSQNLVEELRRNASHGASVPDLLRLLHGRLGHAATYGTTLAKYFMAAFELPLHTVTPIGGWAPDCTGEISDVRIQELIYPEIVQKKQLWDLDRRDHRKCDQMKALLVRIGVDTERGNWNAPVDANGCFVYVPIPQKTKKPFKPGSERFYREVLPALQRFCGNHNCDLYDDLGFPKELLEQSMHLDPDFEYLTYGDGNNKSDTLGTMNSGDLLVFYGGLRPVDRFGRKESQDLIYALMGMYVVKEVLIVAKVPKERWLQSVHLRRMNPEETDIVVWAKPEISGRFNRCIPVGDWRENAYRVRQDLLEAWGGLSVKNGWIQRSGKPPWFNDPAKFLDWFRKQDVEFLARNN